MAQAEWRKWYEDIRAAALRRCPAILLDWLPGGRMNGREFAAAGYGGGAGSSLKINSQTGKHKDFASNEPGGSDLISLYARIKGIEYRDAAGDLAAEFGIEKPKAVHAVENPWDPIIPIPDFAPLTEEGTPVLPPLGARHEKSEIGGMWCYLDGECQPILWRVRVNAVDGGKDIIPLTYCRNRASGATEWRWKDVPAPRPLYGLELLAFAEPEAPVLIVSGEKVAEAARRILPDWIVVTNAGGDNRISTKYTDWSPILNRKAGRIVIWPDNDEPGIKAAAGLAHILDGKCDVVRPDPAWKKGWDLADGDAEGWDGAKALAYLEAHLITPVVAPMARMICDISGSDIELRSRAVWNAIAAVNDPPWLLAAASGLTIVDRDVFGRARRRLVTPERLLNALARRIEFQHYDSQGRLISCTPPEKLVMNLIVEPAPPLGFLRRMAEVPILASDGRLICREGFDAKSGVYYLPHPDLDGIDIMPHPDLDGIDIADEPPGSDEIAGAVAMIDDLLADFPFVEDCDRAHAIAFALVPFVRLTIAGRTPLFRFEAPQARTGKSMLMRLLARLSCSVISDIGPTTEEEEWRKRITSALREEPEAFLIDNATALDSAQLKKLLTDDVWEDRQLGASEQTRHPVQCVFGCTLNNPVIGREMMGRSLRVRLDARSEHPESRAGFRHPNIEEYARENRAALVAALITIARAADAPDPDAATLGGFEAFCRRMAAILQAAGIAGFLGDREDDSALDAEDSTLQGFVQAWAVEFGDRQVFTPDLLRIAEGVEGMYLGRADSDRGKITALGRFLHRHRGATVEGWTIGNPHKTRPITWRLHEIGAKSQTVEKGYTRSEGDDADELGADDTTFGHQEDIPF